jgi:LysR family glycine cleavage system transcriptional activator
MRLPSLKFLKTFQVAAARLSFKAAAEELFITPSAVSHQIKALEEQLGMPLFERGPHSLTLTEAGTHYLQHMDSVFARLESVTEQLQVRYGRGVVRLHMPPFFATELLLPKLPACAPSLLVRNPIRKVEDLDQHTLIVNEARLDAWERWAESLGKKLRPKKIVRFDTMYAAAQAAEHGVGVALVASRFGNERFAQGSLVQLFDTELETGESYFLLLRREDASRPDVLALTQWLLKEFRVAA